MKNRFKILSQHEEKKQVEVGEKVQYYSALINGWINTRMEADKSILTFSLSAVGLLFTILAAIKIEGTLIYLLFLFAIFCFLLCAVTTIKVFDKNSDLLQSIANDTDVEKNDKVLKKLDLLKNILFFVGLGLTFLLSIILVIQKTSEVEMAKKGSSNTVKKTVNITNKKSLQGFQNMKPSGSPKDSSENNNKKSGK